MFIFRTRCPVEIVWVAVRWIAVVWIAAIWVAVDCHAKRRDQFSAIGKANRTVYHAYFERAKRTADFIGHAAWGA